LTTRRYGILCKWNDEKAFGFLQPDDGGRDIFIHLNSFRAAMIEPMIDSRYSFTVEAGRKLGQQQATNVERAPYDGATIPEGFLK
jgi:cold shock CspA family protein